MSRIGKQPITLPSGVTVDIATEIVTIKGSKGTLTFNILPGVQVASVDGKINITVKTLKTNKKERFGGLHVPCSRIWLHEFQMDIQNLLRFKVLDTNLMSKVLEK